MSNPYRTKNILLVILTAGLLFIIIPAVIFASSQNEVARLTVTPGGETLPTRTPILIQQGWMPVVLNDAPPTPTIAPTVTPAATTTGCSPLPNPAIAASDAAVEALLVSEINGYRGTHSLAAYTVNDQLLQAARRHAMNMGSFSDSQLNSNPHLGSDGTLASQRIAESCYPGTLGTEIVGWGYTTVTAMMEGFWKISSVHNSLLLDTQRNEFGPAYMNLPGTQYTHYWTVTMGNSTPIGRDVALFQCTYTFEDAEAKTGLSVSTWQQTPCDN